MKDDSNRKVKFSKKDTRGHLYVDCSECNRGGNGLDKDKCSAGSKHKRGNKGGCFIGELIPGLYL